MAFVGIVIGAGFATGQEVLQYFVSYGRIGILGALIAGIIMAIVGLAAIQLGSYFLANDHGTVLRRISHPVVARILDIGVIITLFCTGFVMFAGAGSNMQQQFGWNTAWGALLMLVLVAVAGLLDVDRLTTVIGALTPVIVMFVLLAVFYVIATTDGMTDSMQEAALAVESPTPTWWLSALNYVGLTLMMGVSMSMIIGGNNIDPRPAGYGGLLGGLIFGILMVLTTYGLYLDSESVAQDDVPMLSIVTSINETLGLVMSIVIIGMIFNTAIAMFYAFGKRVTAKKPERFYLVFLIACIAGFGCSFLGFRTLVGLVYPILGYMGIVLIVVVASAWFMSIRRIREEQERREKIHVLVRRKLDPGMRFSSKQERLLERYAEESNLDSEQLTAALEEEIDAEILADAEADADTAASEAAVAAVAASALAATTTDSQDDTAVQDKQSEHEHDDRLVSAGDPLTLPEHAQPKVLDDLSTITESVATEPVAEEPVNGDIDNAEDAAQK